jgi:hypothetical protein
MAGPSTKPKGGEGAPVFVPHPDDIEAVREGLEQAERGEGVRLTAEELERWANTGELPCLGSPSSRHAT